MPQPRQPLYSKSRNRDVVKFIALNADLRGTDLFELINFMRSERAICSLIEGLSLRDFRVKPRGGRPDCPFKRCS